MGCGWSYSGRVTTTGVPSDSYSVKYEYVGQDWSSCGTGCTRAPKKVWNKYVGFPIEPLKIESIEKVNLDDVGQLVNMCYVTKGEWL